MAVYNVEKINNWLSKFSKAKTDYNDDYLKYKDTYIYTTSESTVNRIKQDLNKNYDRIQRIYKNIYDQWNRYLNDLKATDNYLAGTGSAGSVKASSVSSKLSKLPKLKEYHAGAYEKLSAVNAKLGTIKTVGWTDGKTIDENLSNVMAKTGATISVAAVSVVEGVGIFAEGLVDCAALIVGGVGTALNYTYGFFANDLDSSDELNELMWKDVRAFVSKEHVKTAFDSFYENNDTGKSMKENAFGFDMVRSVGNEVGEVVGAVTVSALTGGVVNPAVLYGASKVGNHTEENWQDESTSTAAGLVKGVFQGVGDGVFFAIGLKGDKVMKKAATEAVKKGGEQALKKTAILSVKTLFESGCSVAQDGSNILINALFSNDTVKTQSGEIIRLNTFSDKLNYYYEQAGGKEGLMTSMATAGVLSFMSDTVDISKIGKNIDTNTVMKNTDLNVNNIKNTMEGVNPKNIEVSVNPMKSDINLDSFRKEYDELLKKSKESWFIQAKEASDNGWAWDLNKVSEADNIIKRMQELESTLGVKNTGVPESKIYDYSDVKKEADAMVQKIKNKPIPTLEKYKVDEITKLKEISKTTEKSLKNDITSSIMPDYNEIQKMRKIYIELNKRTNYDVDFVLGDKETKNAILNKFTTFDNLKNGNVVCKGWSELYTEALIESGIDPSRVKVVKAPKNNHWWVEIDMGDNIIRADATDAFLGSTDLANCKFGDSTNGFLILNKADSGFRVTNDTLKNHPEILKKSNAYFRDVDKSIDYVKDNKYFTENVTKLREAFSSTSSPYDDIIKQNDILKKNVHSFMNLDIPKNMNGYDAFAYYRKFSNTLFNGSDNAIPHLKKINIDGKDYSATIVEMFDGENKFYLTFDEINGKKIYTNEEYINGPSKNYKGFK